MQILWTQIIALRISVECMGNHPVGRYINILPNPVLFSLFANTSFHFQTLMGVFYYIRAVALLEDLPLESEGDEPHTIDRFITTVEAGYTQVSKNLLSVTY